MREVDIHDRLYKFARATVILVKKLPKTVENLVLIKQTVRAVTSSGANAIEADGANTKSEFIYKMSIAQRELKETNYWLRLLKETTDKFTDELDALLRENDELIKISSSIVLSAKKQ